jgi:hypothetical protein
MARINSLSLEVGRGVSLEFAQLTITVAWTLRERDENLWYLLSGYLIERDDERDFFAMLPDGEIHWNTIGNRDDFVGAIGKQWVRPSGQTTRSYTLRRDWDFGDRESGSEEYLGVATVVPEVRSDIRFSCEVNANLG